MNPSFSTSTPYRRKTGHQPENTHKSESSAESSAEKYDFDAEALLFDQLDLLGMTDPDNELREKMEEIRSTPLFSAAVAKLGRSSRPGLTFPQFGLLAGRRKRMMPQGPPEGDDEENQDPRIFLNVNAPWSAFICGSQGSGKSHSLSCMLENCLLPNPRLGLLPKPLTALVFHYDSFTSIAGGQVCEAAYLCSAGLPVKVLVSPTNLAAMRALYSNIPGLPPGTTPPTVEPFFLDQRYLNAERLMTLMAAESSEGSMPLYMQTALQVLREMARETQSEPGINYTEFKNRVLAKGLSPGQLAPLSLRLDLLESFINSDEDLGFGFRKKTQGNDWTHAPGSLTIVDLSCPFVDSDTACGLFQMCLGVFLEQEMDIGRVIVLDEAHKFMLPSSTPAQKLTDSLIAAIRLQRHLACRIIIATQEPTISPRLLDLCSITLVHRFSSPEWMKMLRGHLAAAAVANGGQRGRGRKIGRESRDRDESARSEEFRENEDIFHQIVTLGVGEALLFAPAGMLDLDGGGVGVEPMTPEGITKEKLKGHGIAEVDVPVNDEEVDEETCEKVNTESHGEPKPLDLTLTPVKLGATYLKIRIRDRLTADGGRSRCVVSS